MADVDRIQSDRPARGAKAPRRSPEERNGNASLSAPPRLNALDVGDDDQPIPPRHWLLGTAFCRQFVSGLAASGGRGKTTLRIVQALSLASARSLTGEHVFLRCRVLIVCLEDGLVELRRRVRAAMKHHDVTREEVRGHLFLTTPERLKLAVRDPKTGAAVAGDLDAALRSFVSDEQIDLVILDPVKKAHSVAENSTDDMDVVVTLMAQIAIEKNIAFDYLAHERKGSGEAGDADRARGAGSMKDGGRLIYTLTAMSPDEQRMFGVNDEDRKSLFRVDSAKVNIAPASASTTWFRLVGVRLENGDETYPNGDEVQTVERWTPPKTFDGFSTQDLTKPWRSSQAACPTAGATQPPHPQRAAQRGACSKIWPPISRSSAAAPSSAIG
jgi:hypothetical protein